MTYPRYHHHYHIHTGPTGWYVYYSKGAPRNHQLFVTQVPPGEHVLLVTRYPPGTTFSSIRRVFRCGGDVSVVMCL